MKIAIICTLLTLTAACSKNSVKADAPKNESTTTTNPPVEPNQKDTPATPTTPVADTPAPQSPVAGPLPLLPPAIGTAPNPALKQGLAYTGDTRWAIVYDVQPYSYGPATEGHYRYVNGYGTTARYVDLIDDGALAKLKARVQKRLAGLAPAVNNSSKIARDAISHTADIAQSKEPMGGQLIDLVTDINPQYAIHYQIHANALGAAKIARLDNKNASVISRAARLKTSCDSTPKQSFCAIFSALIEEDLIASQATHQNDKFDASVLGIVVRDYDSVKTTLETCSDQADGGVSPRLQATYDLIQKAKSTLLHSWAVVDGASKFDIIYDNGEQGQMHWHGSLVDRDLWPVHVDLVQNGKSLKLENEDPGFLFLDNNPTYKKINKIRLTVEPAGILRIELSIPGCQKPAVLKVQPSPASHSGKAY